MSKRIFTLFFVGFLVGLILPLKTQAFSQDYTPMDTGLVYQEYFDLINIEPSWSHDLQINKEVVVAILDSGIDVDHPDLMANLWQNPGEIEGNDLDDDRNSYIDDMMGWDFVDSDNLPEPDLDGEYDPVAVNHGTVIAGIIAAAENEIGVIGIAPQVKIMPLRILNEKGQGNTLILSQAIDYAVEKGADIINLSLVGISYDDILKQSIKNAYDKGVVVIAASGNEQDEGIDLDKQPRYPVCEIDEINRVLGIAAVDQNKQLTAFSNFGQSCIDLSAPGTNFYTTTFYQEGNEDFDTYYDRGWSGTSVAAPIVAATAALVKMNYPEFRPYDIYNILRSSTQSLAEDNPDNYADLGTGLIDVGAALERAESIHNQSRKIVLAPDISLPPEIFILDEEGDLESSFLAYAEKFKGGVNLAVGDVNDDGQPEIITAPRPGGGPHIRVFSQYGQLLAEFFAYDASFDGGVNLAVGDIDGNGQLEIVTAPMSRGGPHIRAFNYQGQLRYQFFAYPKDYSGGVNLAIGDVNNNGRDEIVTAPANNFKPEIRVFDYRNLIKARFLAYDQEMQSGVKLTIGDVNNDDWAEIITAPAHDQSAQIKLLSFKGRLKAEFLAYTSQLTTGIDLIARDFSGDDIPEIMTLPHKGSAALLKIYDSFGLEKNSFYLRENWDKNGYQIELLNF